MTWGVKTYMRAPDRDAALAAFPDLVDNEGEWCGSMDRNVIAPKDGGIEGHVSGADGYHFQIRSHAPIDVPGPIEVLPTPTSPAIDWA